jgi:hypothetical protein
METRISVIHNLKQYNGQSIPTQNWDMSDDIHINYPAFLNASNKGIYSNCHVQN